jgi:hypothetical protein
LTECANFALFLKTNVLETWHLSCLSIPQTGNLL